MLICPECFKRDLNHSESCSSHNQDRIDSINKDRNQCILISRQRKLLQQNTQNAINKYNDFEMSMSKKEHHDIRQDVEKRLDAKIKNNMNNFREICNED